MVGLQETLDSLFLRIDESIPDTFEHVTNLKAVVIGLSNKAISHCETAKDLAFKGKLSEAAILLRCAFESIVIMHYLLNHKAEVAHYFDHSQLVAYKDRKASYERSALRALPIPTKNLTEHRHYITSSQIHKQKRYFKRHKYEKVQNPDTLLTDAKELAESLAISFKDTRDMVSALKKRKPDLYTHLVNLQSILYNRASQIVHSLWHTVIEYHVGYDAVGKPFKPLYGPELLIADIILVTDFAIQGIDTVGLVAGLRTELETAFKPAYDRIFEAMDTLQSTSEKQ